MKAEELEADSSLSRKPFGALLIFITTTIIFWVSMEIIERGMSLIMNVIMKFVVNLSVILWINSAFYLRESARGVNLDTREFQKNQVKLTIWIFIVLIVSELPMWIYVLSAQ